MAEQQTKTVKVTLTATVEIDPDDWELAFGIPRDEIPDDVKSYMAEGLRHHGVFGNGEVDVKSFDWK